MGQLPAIESFLARRFQSLSASALNANLQVGAQSKAPSFASSMFWDLPNELCFGSNLVITRYGFCNTSHVDPDATCYAFGLFGIIDQYTGLLYHFPTTGPSPTIEHASMLFEDYHFSINLGGKNKVLEMTWSTRVLHNSTPSVTRDEDGIRLDPKDSIITIFGSSIQISNSLVQRVSHFFRDTRMMADQEVDKYLLRYGDYHHEFQKKYDKYHTENSLGSSRS